MKTRQEITATIYDKRGKILAIGKNSYEKTHPIQSKFAKQAGLPQKEQLHTEVAAIIRALKRGSPYKIKVERFDKKGFPLNAEPCPICKLAIKEAGIKIIEYTI